MSNWVNNTLRIKKDIAEKYLINSRQHVDFDILKREPVALRIQSAIDDRRMLVAFLTDEGKKSADTVIRENQEGLNAYASACWSKQPEISLRKDAKELQNYFPTKEQMMDAREIGNIMMENFKKYGSVSSYFWRLQNWGTKTNSMGSRIEEDGDYLRIEFDTLNRPPFELLEELAKKGDFRLISHVEGCGTVKMEAKDGVLNDLGVTDICQEDE